ncbi:MAG TPA: hypothetical protein VID29_05100 [Solirubrobacteraceae bacterium]|jgi:hypothetical protein
MRTAKAISVLGATAALVAGAVAVSGCGASATLDPIARAAEVTSEQSGARISLTMQFSSAALPGAVSMTATGYVDERHKAAAMSMDFSHVPGMASLSGNGTMRMVFLYPVIYMNMPLLAGKLPAGKTWLKLDIGAASKAAGVDLSQMSSFNQADPSQFLSYLRASSGGVVSFGREMVNGTETTHYHAALALSRIAQRLPGDQQAAVRAALEKLGESGSLPVDVWVDGLGRVRREQIAIGAGASSGTPLSGTITIDFTSFGAVPPITAPAAAEVFDATAAVSARMQGGQGGQ